MIIVKLMGGLGNQLFQYAFGRALAARSGQPLVLDTGHFDSVRPGETPRDYRLHHYPIAARAGVSSSTRKLLDISRKRKKLKARIVRKLFNVQHINEPGFPYAEVKQPRGRGLWYYEGYWQSPRYFDAVRAELLQELQPKVPPSAANAALLERISSCDSVSLHIRRGDYVSHAPTNAFHGVCSPEYYEQAMATMAQTAGAPTFFVFSDDIPWARDNIRSQWPLVFVDLNDDASACEDLRLMSACRHHIVANSSFSWWGAWLNPYADRKVIAPKRWFTDPSMDCRDLVPVGWTRL